MDETDLIKSEMIARTSSLAYLKAMEETLLLIAEKAHIEEIEGLPVKDYIQKSYEEHLGNLLIQVEEKDPTSAALLQEWIDRKK